MTRLTLYAVEVTTADGSVSINTRTITAVPERAADDCRLMFGVGVSRRVVQQEIAYGEWQPAVTR